MTASQVLLRPASPQPADGGSPPGGNLLFLVRADGRLAPVTRSGPPDPEAGDTMVLLRAEPAITSGG